MPRRIALVTFFCVLLLAGGMLSPAAAAPADREGPSASLWSRATAWLIHLAGLQAGASREVIANSGAIAAGAEGGPLTPSSGAAPSSGPDHGPQLDPDG